MIERFNDSISDVLASMRFRSRDNMDTTLRRYAILFRSAHRAEGTRHKLPIDTLPSGIGSNISQNSFPRRTQALES